MVNDGQHVARHQGAGGQRRLAHAGGRAQKQRRRSRNARRSSTSQCGAVGRVRFTRQNRCALLVRRMWKPDSFLGVARFASHKEMLLIFFSTSESGFHECGRQRKNCRCESVQFVGGQQQLGVADGRLVGVGDLHHNGRFVLRPWHHLCELTFDCRSRTLGLFVVGSGYWRSRVQRNETGSEGACFCAQIYLRKMPIIRLHFAGCYWWYYWRRCVVWLFGVWSCLLAQKQARQIHGSLKKINKSSKNFFQSFQTISVAYAHNTFTKTRSACWQTRLQVAKGFRIFFSFFKKCLEL